ncbi:hypothetical protein BDW59DRAFT_151835 [Aspergillus cavernicola]|uniref:Pal1 cell morphology protein-domain-containing protein n=1 Tax=Aspergillus cavernicola TaxID=176166 RepID=A0ABR4HTQ5_9EURO
MSFSRFRKPNPNTSKPLYERRDISYNPSYMPPNNIDDDIIPLTGSSASSSSTSRRNSFTLKALSPRRLSIRLKSRSSPPSPSSLSSSSSSSSDQKKEKHRTHSTPDNNITRSYNDKTARRPKEPLSGGGRGEFIYKPLHRQDYPTVVAETVAAQSRPASRYAYNYIPAASGTWGGELSVPMQPRARSRSRSRSRPHYTLDDDRHELHDDMDNYGHGNGRSSEGGTSRASIMGSRREYSHPDIYTSAAEKRLSRAARRLTTVMVPDADEIYG